MKTPRWMRQGLALGAYPLGMCLGLAEHCLGKVLSTKLIETLYMRYVWPQRMPKEWTPEAQMESLRLEHAEFFRGRWEVGMALDSTGPLGQMLADLVRALIVDKRGKVAPNYSESQIMLEQWADLEGELAERVTLTIQRCKGKTPHELKAAAEAELRQQKLTNNDLRNECTRLSEELEKANAELNQGPAECGHSQRFTAMDKEGEYCVACRFEAIQAAAAATEHDKKAFADAAERAKEDLLEADVQRVELATKLDNLRETWAKTVKANTELGTAHVEALCEIDELRRMVWHFALRPDLSVHAALQAFDARQREKLQAIWRVMSEQEKQKTDASAGAVGATAAAISASSTIAALAASNTTAQP